MMGQTLLIRNGDGDYSPAHRSLLEFFVAYKSVAQLGVLASDFTEIARSQSYIDDHAAPVEYTWSLYFRRELNEQGKVKLIPPLKAFTTEDMNETQGRRDIVGFGELPRNTLVFAAGMVSNEPLYLDKLCEMAWEKTGNLAWDAFTLLTALKHQYSETLVNILIEKSEGRPLRSGVAWVLGELGIASDKVTDALERTIRSYCKGADVSSSAWWESAFALEKLGKLGERKGRQGDEAINLLIENLPSGLTIRRAIENLDRAIRSDDSSEATIKPSDIVMIMKHESEINPGDFFRQTLGLIDFLADTKGRRCYYVVWLCGHLGIGESLTSILKAARNPLSSVRNSVCEALGKLGNRFPEVIETLEERLSDSYYRTRFHAAWSLGELGSSGSIPKLAAAIKVEEVRDVREEMIRVRKLLSESV